MEDKVTYLDTKRVVRMEMWSRPVVEQTAKDSKNVSDASCVMEEGVSLYE